MKNLEAFPKLDKWLDDATFDSNDIEWQQNVVDSEEVAKKLTELGCIIENLEIALDIATLELKVKTQD